MPLSAVMESLDGLSEDVAALFTQKGDKFELTGVQGVRTQADLDRISGALDQEKREHKETKGKYSWAAEMNGEEVLASLDRIPELEAASKGQLDEAQIEEMVTRRVEGTIKSQTAPLERTVGTLTQERDTAMEELTSLRGQILERDINEAFMGQLGSKIEDTAHADAKMLGKSIFEKREDDGAIVTKEGTEFTPGLTPEQLLPELQEKRRHWFGQTGGGGGGGSRTQLPGGGNNPWSADHWNLTEQGRVMNEKGRDYADRMAKAAGTTVGGLKPMKAK